MGAKECAEHLATKGFDIGAMPAAPLPAALVRRRDGRLLHRPRRQRAAVAYVFE